MTVDEVKDKVVPILKRYGVKRAALFGSLARGEDIKKSDIDFLVELPQEASLLDLAGLKIDLEELLGQQVDIITYNSLHPLLKDRILSEEVAIL